MALFSKKDKYIRINPNRSSREVPQMPIALRNYLPELKRQIRWIFQIIVKN